MKKYISYWSMPGGTEAACPIPDAVEAAKAASFDGIELAVSADEGEFSTVTDKATCERYAEMVRGDGLEGEVVAAGITWGCSPTDPDADVRKKSIEYHALALQRTAWYGGKAMLMVPGAVSIPFDPGYPKVPYDKAVEWASEAASQLAKVAEELDVQLCLENVWNGLFYSPLEFKDFIDNIGSSHVGIYFDVGNVLGYHQDPVFWINFLGDRIKRVHIKDFKTEVGSLAGFCDLLEGDVPFPESMAALRAIGYDKSVVAEMMPPEEGLLDRTSKAMDKIFAM